VHPEYLERDYFDALAKVLPFCFDVLSHYPLEESELRYVLATIAAVTKHFKWAYVLNRFEEQNRGELFPAVDYRW